MIRMIETFLKNEVNISINIPVIVHALKAQVYTYNVNLYVNLAIAG